MSDLNAKKKYAEYKGPLGLMFMTNHHAGDGILAHMLTTSPPNEFVIALTTYSINEKTKTENKYSKYAKASKKKVEELIQKNHNGFEVMMPDRKMRVPFDIDLKGVDDPLEKCKEILSEVFPNCIMNISGSRTIIDHETKLTKFSYHIILDNYVVDGSDQLIQSGIKDFAIHYEYLGFDPNVYKVNGQLKYINQSKEHTFDRNSKTLNIDGRVQKYIEGSESLLKHTVHHSIDENAIDVNTIDLSVFKSNSVLGKKRKRDYGTIAETRIDGMEIKPRELPIPEDFNINDADPLECLCLFPNDPRGTEFMLSNRVQWNLMRWCKWSGISWEDTWNWLKKKDDSMWRYIKYYEAFKRCDIETYPARPGTMKTLLSIVYGKKILESQDYKVFKEWMQHDYDLLIPDQFLLSEYYNVIFKHIVAHVGLGGGKTKSVIDHMIELKREFPDLRLLVITCRIALTHEQKQKLDQMGIPWMSYIGKNKSQIESEDPDNLICSITSLNKLPKTPYDIVMIDECRTVLSMFANQAGHCHTDLVLNWTNFLATIRDAKKVFWMDGFVTNTVLNMIKKVNELEDAGSVPYVIGRKMKQPERIFREVEDTEEFYKEIFDAIDRGEKIFIATPKIGKNETTGQIASVEHIVSTLINKYEWTRGTEIIGYHSGMKDEKKKLIKVNEIWSDPKVRVVVANGALSVGIDFNVENVFDRIFGLFSKCTMSHFDFFQLLYRVRHPINKEMILLYSKEFYPSSKKPDHIVPTDEIYTEMVKRFELEDRTCRKDERRAAFKLFCRQMNIAFTRETNKKMTEDERNEIKSFYNSSEVLFRWEKIPMPSEKEMEKMMEKMDDFGTVQQLQYDKYIWNDKLKADTPEEEKIDLFNTNRNFLDQCEYLQLSDHQIVRKNVEREMPSALVIKQFFLDNQMILGDVVPMKPVCTTPHAIVRKSFNFHNPITSFTHDRYSKMLNAYFGMPVYERYKEGKKNVYKYKTKETYVEFAKFCKEWMKIYDDSFVLEADVD